MTWPPACVASAPFDFILVSFDLPLYPMDLLKEKDSLVKPAFEDLVLLAPLSVLLSVMLMHQASKIQKNRCL